MTIPALAHNFRPEASEWLQYHTTRGVDSLKSDAEYDGWPPTAESVTREAEDQAEVFWYNLHHSEAAGHRVDFYEALRACGISADRYATDDEAGGLARDAMEHALIASLTEAIKGDDR